MDKYIIALLKFKGIGSVKVLNYVLKYNKNVIDLQNHLEELVKQSDICLFENYLKEAEIEILKNRNNGINIISVLNNNYPDKLLEIKEPILYLYYKGDISLIYNNSVAIIGSRNIESFDEELTREISSKIASHGITVISGLAIGTDANAHIGSYNKKGKTIAILPSGLNIITPSNNKKIADNILNNGGLLVSEYSIDTIPNKYNFVKRDRIQAALCDVVIVIKADEKSGTMNAVKVAQSVNKYVTQYVTNNNKLILNSFNNTDEDIKKIISRVEKQEYKMNNDSLYKQESLF